MIQKSRAPPRESQTAKLSCEQCQQRKTKCDKEQPCGACQRVGLECTVVQRRRLPRGRTGAGKGRDANLKDRVARLENLLSGGSSSGAETQKMPPGTHPVDTRQVVEFNHTTCLVIIANISGSHLNLMDRTKGQWGTLPEFPFGRRSATRKVAGIRELLDEEFPDNDSDTPHQNSDLSHQGFDIILFGTSSCAVNPSILEAPSRPVVRALLETYLHRVDPVFKATHAPTLRAIMLGDQQGCADSLDSPALEALRFSVYFTAVCAQGETECSNLFQENKSSTANRFRLATEVMLSRANLQNSRDTTVFQAFIIYLAGRRTCFGYKNISTLVAIAIRIGQNLRLGTDDQRISSPYKLEIRRRLWSSIGILDMQAAFDTGSHSILAHAGKLGSPPMRINDADISPFFDEPLTELHAFTDMSFSSMTIDAHTCWRKLTLVPNDSEVHPTKTTQDWAVRSRIVTDLEQVIHERYLNHCDLAQPFQVFTKLVGEGIIITLRLLERRPLHPFLSTGPPPEDDFDVLKVATEVLEGSLIKYTYQSLAPWRWFTWAKWYALAVVLAELCGNSSGFSVDRAWSIAEACFSEYTDGAIDNVLWRSIEKLMVKARSVRDGLQAPLHTPSNVAESHTISSQGTPKTIGLDKLHIALPNQDDTLEDQECAQHQCQTQGSAMGAEYYVSQSPQQILTPERNISVPELWMNESDAMSWVNWDLFVQDVTSFSESEMQGSTFWG